MGKKTKMKSILLVLILIFLMSNNFLLAGDVTISQVATVKNNGSGKIELTYSTKGSLLSNYTIGNYVFGPKENEARFKSTDTKVEKTNFYKSTKDTSISVASVIVEYQNLNTINKAKGFADVKASWTNTAGGNEFKWIIPANPKSAAQISQYTYKITFDDKVLSSNGQTIEGNTVTWYKDKGIDPNKDIVLTALIKSDGSTPTGTGEQKSCGLFGLELPVLMFAGYVFSYSLKRKRSVK